MGLAEAQDKAPRHRGNIIEINVEAKTLTLDKPNGTTQVVTWDDSTSLQSDSFSQISDLKPGVFVRCSMSEDGSSVIRIRHEPERDKASED